MPTTTTLYRHFEFCCFTDLHLQEPEVYTRITEFVKVCKERREYCGHDDLRQGLELLSARFETLEATDSSSDSDDTDLAENDLN